MIRARRGHREAVALCVSLAAHGALGWALVRLVPWIPPASRRSPPLEVVLLPRAAEGGRIAPPAPPISTPPAVPHRRSKRPGPAAQAAAGAPAPERPPGRDAPAPGTGAWMDAEGLAGPVRPSGAPALDPHLPLGDGPGPAIEGGGDPSAPEGPSVTAARVRRTLTSSFADLEAAERTRFPDPYWIRVRDGIGADLRVPWELLARGGPDERVVTRSRVAQAAQGLMRWDPRRSAPARDRDSRLSPTAQGVLDAGRPENRLFLTELVTRVELTQAADGAVVEIRLVQSSGNGPYDALVLARFDALGASAVEALGAPPARGRRTRWAIGTRFEMAPPVPVVGCGFDANFRPTGCFYPLKRSTHTRVDLERLWD